MGEDADSRLWRDAMGGFLTGVTIVTTQAEGGRPTGSAVNAFCALSMNPRLLLVCMDRDSRTLAALRRAGTFCVNILSANQADIVRRFASKEAGDRFAGVPFARRPSGDPVLLDSAAWFDCEVHDLFEGGDHEIVVGRVNDLYADRDADPLAYHRGRICPLPASQLLPGAQR